MCVGGFCVVFFSLPSTLLAFPPVKKEKEKKERRQTAGDEREDVR